MIWTDREFVGHDFGDEDLSGLHTQRVVFDDCNFSGATLSESEHTGTAFRNCRFDRATLWHSVFRQCSLLGSMFSQCRLRPVTFDEVDFTLAVLGGADLAAPTCPGAGCAKHRWWSADLRKAVLRNADLTGARTIGTRLDDADLRGARVDPTFWTTARLPDAKVDIHQALAFAAAHGLDVHGE